ncbi:hypothetical protein V6N11_048047 [Hibiscus sabdariffa]|uniref:Uncharacterized protein n=1 Tax=Hibiscus sabdariffa TaxID=183260 RepID=A0ABR1ZM24_9ROSI
MGNDGSKAIIKVDERRGGNPSPSVYIYLQPFFLCGNDEQGDARLSRALVGAASLLYPILFCPIASHGGCESCPSFRFIVGGKSSL